jgi:hypothetical protein
MGEAPKSLWQVVVARSRVLAYLGLANAALFVLLLPLALADGTEITGANRWVKPMKFAASVAVYAWTLGWYLGYLRSNPASVRVVSCGVAFCMGVEIACVVLQAARGKVSHFNTDPGFDGAVFSVMGILIVANTLLVIYTLVLFCVSRVELPAAYLLGIRLGLLIFLVAGLEGFVMTTRAAHTVGLADGGPGLPVLKWSTVGGDLRVAHFVGLHALQLLPLVGYWLSRRRRTPVLGPVSWTVVAAVLYALLAGALFLQAVNGKPIIPVERVWTR